MATWLGMLLGVVPLDAANSAVAFEAASVDLKAVLSDISGFWGLSRVLVEEGFVVVFVV